MHGAGSLLSRCRLCLTLQRQELVLPPCGCDGIHVDINVFARSTRDRQIRWTIIGSMKCFWVVVGLNADMESFSVVCIRLHKRVPNIRVRPTTTKAEETQAHRARQAACIQMGIVPRLRM